MVVHSQYVQTSKPDHRTSRPSKDQLHHLDLTITLGNIILVDTSWAPMKEQLEWAKSAAIPGPYLKDAQANGEYMLVF